MFKKIFFYESYEDFKDKWFFLFVIMFFGMVVILCFTKVSIDFIKDDRMYGSEADHYYTVKSIERCNKHNRCFVKLENGGHYNSLNIRQYPNKTLSPGDKIHVEWHFYQTEVLKFRCKNGKCKQVSTCLIYIPCWFNYMDKVKEHKERFFASLKSE